MHDSPTMRRDLPVRPSEDERRENTVRSTFVNVTSAIGHRPEPVRSRFDKAASTEARRPWRGFTEPLRATAIEARRRDCVTRERTEQLIIGAVAALLDYVLEPLDVTTDDVCYPVLAKEESEAIGAQAKAHMLPTRENLEAADRETAQSITAGRIYRARLQERQLGASPRGVA